MNSNSKGKRGERALAKLLEQCGYEARRAQQYCGAAEESSDLVTNIPWLRIEAKNGYDDVELHSAMLKEWMDKLSDECVGEQQPFICHKRSRKPWICYFFMEGILVGSTEIKEAIEVKKNRYVLAEALSETAKQL